MRKLRHKYVYNTDVFYKSNSCSDEERRDDLNETSRWKKDEGFVEQVESSKDRRDVYQQAQENVTLNVITTRPKVSGLGASKIKLRLEYRDKSLDEFQMITVLGVGAFGKVKLVQDKNFPERVFALKVLSKECIVAKSQQEHVMNEKKILISSYSPFIIQLYKTFKDNRYVYLLMEVCLGGELWTILRDHRRFDEQTTRFYAACVVEALDYLHQRDIAYRDLKPENLMMDSSGYVKLIDFGLAKKVSPGRKTGTFCGTPEYAAPEVLLGKGHDCSVDCWGLGILIYEMMTGDPPFTIVTGTDISTVFQTILGGFDEWDFSTYITKETKCIIKKLCKSVPEERLGNPRYGINVIRKNKWFKNFNWNLIKEKTMKAPFLPKIKSLIDTTNFDEHQEYDDVPLEECSGWDEHF